MTKLLKCPFCGGEARLNYFGGESHIPFHQASCSECGCKQANSIHKESVINAWNTRTPMANIVEKLEEEKKRLKGLKNDCIALSDSEVIAIEEKAYNFAINIVKQEINNGLE